MKKELIDTVIECIEEFTKAYERSVRCLRSLRTRARTLPSDLFSQGLAYVLTLTAARSAREFIELGLSSESCSDVIGRADDLRRKLGVGDEEFGYAIYGALLAFILKKLGVVKEVTFADLVRSSISNPVRENMALEVAGWLKRMVEAYIHER